MDIEIKPKPLSGEISAISSKSDIHRLLICAALAHDTTKIYLNGYSNDILTTVECLKKIGCKISLNDNYILINSVEINNINNSSDRSDRSDREISLNCHDSGSSLRFLIPVIAALGIEAEFIGEGRLPKRPIGVLCEQMAENGCFFSNNSELPFKLSGKMKSGIFCLPGNISSQFITGLLLALPILKGDSQIKLLSPLESAGYVEMTINRLTFFGIKINKTKDGFFVKGNQKYLVSSEIYADGDWSNAAFFLSAGALKNGNIKYNNLNLNSLQKDIQIKDILKRFGADVSCSKNTIICMPNHLHGVLIDVSEIPDLVPILAVVASVSEGKTRIINAERLRLKESDRIKSVSELLKSLGANVKELPSGIEIIGKKFLNGGIVNSFGDHRIVMAAAIATCVCENKVIIKDAECFKKSYDGFFEDFRKLGGEFNVI